MPAATQNAMRPFRNRYRQPITSNRPVKPFHSSMSDALRDSIGKHVVHIDLQRRRQSRTQFVEVISHQPLGLDGIDALRTGDDQAYRSVTVAIARDRILLEALVNSGNVTQPHFLAGLARDRPRSRRPRPDCAPAPRCGSGGTGRPTRCCRMADPCWRWPTRVEISPEAQVQFPQARLRAPRPRSRPAGRPRYRCGSGRGRANRRGSGARRT